MAVLQPGIVHEKLQEQLLPTHYVQEWTWSFQAEFDIPKIHHVTLWVGNAKQAAYYYVVAYGFQHVAYRGLETGSRDVASHVVKQGDAVFVFQSPLNPGNKEMALHLERHGDEVKDIAFEVTGITKLQQRLKSRRAKIVRDLWTEEDDDGTVSFIVVKTFGDTVHTFIERGNYQGKFLPGYVEENFEASALSQLPPTGLLTMDHVVGNQPVEIMNKVIQWYVEMLGFHKFWSVDDRLISTDNTGLKTTVTTNRDENVKVVITEPAPSNGRQGTSQIEEFLRYNDGPGTLHIAFLTENIIESVQALKARGVQFLEIPSTYYEKLEERMLEDGVKGMIQEDMKKIADNHILVDYDQSGYLLQIFTRHLQDRPTIYFELIQRQNHNGFGANNVRALTEAVELQQAKRGNLFEGQLPG